MARFQLICIGKARKGPEQDLFAQYSARLRWPLQTIEMDSKKALSGPALKAAEAELITEKLNPRAKLIALDETGRSLASRDWANQIGQWQDEGIGDIQLVIGGADGLDPSILARADLILSLGRMTWPHLLVRGLIAEQLYRAQQILAGHPYHRD